MKVGGLIPVVVVGYLAYTWWQARQRGDDPQAAVGAVVKRWGPVAVGAYFAYVALMAVMAVATVIFAMLMMNFLFGVLTGGLFWHVDGPFEEMSAVYSVLLVVLLVVFLVLTVWTMRMVSRRLRDSRSPVAVHVSPAAPPALPQPSPTRTGPPSSASSGPRQPPRRRERPLRAAGR